jgi:flagellar hook-associated protein 3 FlgL
MTTRIATNFQSQNSLRSLQQANEALTKTSFQVTSGLKAQRLSDLVADGSAVLTLRDVQAKNKVYLDNLTTVKNQLQASESTLQQLSDLLGEAISVGSLGRNENSATVRASLAPKAQSVTESFYTLYKTQFNGKYLFSGSDAANPPIATVATATPHPGSPVPTTWYQGDSLQPSVITGPGTTLSLGVTGNDATFANMKAGLEALWYGLQNNNITEIDSAVASLKSAQTGLSGLLGQVGGQIKTIDLISERHTTQQQFVQTQLDDLEKVDISQALTQFSQQQTILEASMTLITRVNQLSLLDFLK